MSRYEKFALFAGIIGLVADILTLSTFATLRIGGHGEVQAFAPPSVRAIVAFAFIYSWLIVCWFPIRRAYLLFSERNRTVQWSSRESRLSAHSRAFWQYVASAVFAVAILSSPLAFLLLKFCFPSLGDNAGYALTTALFQMGIGFAICIVMVLAMPVIYGDMEIDLSIIAGL